MSKHIGSYLTALGAGLSLGHLRAAVAVFVILTILFPRFVPTLAMIVCSLTLIVLALNDRRKPAVWWGHLTQSLAPKAIAATIAVFAIGSLWSVEPTNAILKVILMAVIFINAMILIRDAGEWGAPRVTALLQGLVIGMAIISVYIAVETYTGREMSRLLHTWFPYLREGFEKHFHLDEHGNVKTVSHTAFNRSTFAFSVLLWPTFFALRQTFAGWPRVLLLVLLGGVTICILAISSHQSSQLSIAVSLLVFVIAALNLSLARATIAIGIAGLFFAIIPFSLYVERAGWHVDKSIMATGRARFIYWNYTSKQILANPFYGVGTYSTMQLDKDRHINTLEKPDGYVVPPRTSPHPHNAYLQIWYEVGIAGAIAAFTALIALIWQLKSYSSFAQRYCYAGMALIILILVPSYGLWQTWVQAMIGLSAILMAAAARRQDSDFCRSTTEAAA